MSQSSRAVRQTISTTIPPARCSSWRSPHSSLKQDRLSKSRIYAGAEVTEYWILNLRDDCIEVFRTPDAARRVYGARAIGQHGDHLRLVALPEVSVAVDDLLPPRR